MTPDIQRDVHFLMTVGAGVTPVDSPPEVIGFGPRGPSGADGTGDKNYTQTFTDSSSVTVDHNLGKYPAITVIDTAGDEVIGDVDHVGLNQVVISFGAAFSGMVICN